MDNSQPAAVCAICQCPIGGGEGRTACPDCRAEYHEDCWQENGGCAVYGCPQVPQVEARRSVEIPVSFWGQENKPCPACGREILAAAVRCRYCGATFSSAKPEDREAFNQRAALEQRLPKVRQWVIWLFVLSVLPCTAPIGGLWSLIWYPLRRQEVEALPSLYSALAKIGIAVGLGQTVLLALMAMIYSLAHAT
jgi:hypothetical protein